MHSSSQITMTKSVVALFVLGTLWFQSALAFQFIDKDEITQAYNEVRTANSGVTWCAVGYVDRNTLALIDEGDDYYDLLDLFTDDSRVYAYAKVNGKYAFITWIGPNVSPLKKAKVSTDKAFVKELWPNFQKEILADDKSEVTYDNVSKQLDKASESDYGTGK